MSIAKSLESLEQQRAYIANQSAVLGDPHCGSITSIAGRCGKPTCHCHQTDDPGHGPELLLSYKVEGKTATESLPDQAAKSKAERELAEFRKLQALHKQSVEVSAQICQMRPPEPETLSPQEKTAEAIQQEIAREIDRLLRVIFKGRRQSGRFNLEAIKMAMRSAVHLAGATALSKLLQFPAPASGQLRLPCPCSCQLNRRFEDYWEQRRAA